MQITVIAAGPAGHALAPALLSQAPSGSRLTVLASTLADATDHGLRVCPDVDALVRVGVAAGLDEGEVRASLADGRYEAAVAADIDLARQIGVTVPFVVVDMKYAVSGAQPPEVFREVVGSRTTTRGCAAPRSGCSRTRRGPG